MNFARSPGPPVVPPLQPVTVREGDGGGARYEDRLAAEAAQVRASGDLGRSEVLLRLFDFLLECTLSGRSPKEVELAQDVFDKTSEFDTVQDASVRVYVHRLRRKLEEHYAHKPAEGRISIPRGEYRLELTNETPSEPEEASPDQIRPPAGRKTTLHLPRVPVAIAALVCLLNVAGWLVYSAVHSTIPFPEAASTALWRPIGDNQRPTMVVAGDNYMFGETPAQGEEPRIVRALSINSRADLEAYLRAHPDRNGRYADVGIHYLPTSVGEALRNVLPVVNAATVRQGAPHVFPMSDADPGLLRNANIVYVGSLNGLGLLRNPLFHVSGFTVNASYDVLAEKKSNRRFRSDWTVAADNATTHVDYAYLASLPGPAGNRILVIAGMRGAGMTQAAEIASDPKQLAPLLAKVGGGPFEALYEVRTSGNFNLGSTLVKARPLRTDGLW